MHCCDGYVHVPPNTRSILIKRLSCCALRSISDFFIRLPTGCLRPVMECRRNSIVGHFLGHLGLIYQAMLAPGPHNKPWKIRTALLNKILQTTTKRYLQPNPFPSLSPLPRVRSTPFLMTSLTSPIFLPVSFIGIALPYVT